MKTQLLLIFSLLVYGVSAQVVYHPYPQQPATWFFEHLGSAGETYGYYRVIWSGDTTINAQTYTKMYSGYGASATMSPPPPMTYRGAFRQDIAAQQLFFLDSNDVEYDISIDQFAEPGDTIPVTPFLLVSFNFMPEHDAYLLSEGYIEHLVIETVDSTFENGAYRSYFLGHLIDSIGQQAGMVTYTSGIGGSVQYFENALNLTCHSIANELEWGAPQNPASISCTLGVDENIAPSAFRLVPNPADGTVLLFSESDLSVQDIRIIDPSGRTVLESPVIPGSGISVGTLEAGIYLVCFSSGSRRISLPLHIVH